MEYRVIVNESGTFWYKPGTYVIHREDGPAIEYANGNKFWFRDGKYHREDGPAVEYASGNKRWFLNDEELTEAEFNSRMNPVKELTVAQIEELLGHRVKVIK